jgi:fructoselysine 6-kinase
MVVATRGAKGALALASGCFHEQPASPASVVDTLGAGDGFIAACLLAILDGAGIAAALEAGVEQAAQVCGYQGGFGHGGAWASAEAPVI